MDFSSQLLTCADSVGAGFVGSTLVATVTAILGVTDRSASRAICAHALIIAAHLAPIYITGTVTLTAVAVIAKTALWTLAGAPDALGGGAASVSASRAIEAGSQHFIKIGADADVVAAAGATGASHAAHGAVLVIPKDSSPVGAGCSNTYMLRNCSQLRTCCINTYMLRNCS